MNIVSLTVRSINPKRMFNYIDDDNDDKNSDKFEKYTKFIYMEYYLYIQYLLNKSYLPYQVTYQGFEANLFFKKSTIIFYLEIFRLN